MGNIIEQNEQPLICPYFDVECVARCPGWLPDVDDCLFHVCLTQVKESFVAAARYLDKHLGVAEGFGAETLTSLRDLMKGTARQDQREVVRSVLASVIQTAVVPKLAALTVEDIAGLVGKAESRISFVFDKLFGTDDTCGPEIS